jgi:hypothetical protein
LINDVLAQESQDHRTVQDVPFATAFAAAAVVQDNELAGELVSMVLAAQPGTVAFACADLYR